MKRSRFSEEQITNALRLAETALLAAASRLFETLHVAARASS
jgi:hypothetical protein